MDEELTKAIDELEGRRSEDTGTAVHEARKHLKKTRAAIRVVRYDLGEAIDKAAIDLRRQAGPVGLRLYAESPKRFVARVTAYWETRAAQRDAEAPWITRPTATRVRELLEARSSAGPRDRTRIGRELRSVGFHVSEASKHVKASAADFDASDFDALIAGGALRVH